MISAEPVPWLGWGMNRVTWGVSPQLICGTVLSELCRLASVPQCMDHSEA